jgi:C4-dicarboxylate-specific signal transduction histidine kinase
VKSLSRTSRSLAWMVVVVAAIFIPAGTLLISSVSRNEREMNAEAGGILRLERLERHALGLAGIVRDPDAPAQEAQVLEWTGSLLALAPEDPEFRDVHAEVQSAILALGERGEGSAITAAVRGIDRMQEILRKDLTRRSRQLVASWKQLNFMAILSCALAVTLALVLFAYDRSVLDRKRVEAEEQTLRAELAHVGRLSVVGEMGTKMAHELNQPLGAIHSYLAGCVRRLQQREGDPAEMIRALKAAAQEAKRASALIQGLRDFARNARPAASAVDINDLVLEVLPLLAAELRECRVEPELHLTEGIEAILVDRIQMGQVIVNLVRNALEAMAATPVGERRLVIRTGRAPDHRVEVSVEDSGCGIREELLPSLFQPFHTTKPKGMGMGLAISRTIVEAHDGWIRAEHRPGGGSIFRFQIPCPSLVTA